MIITKSRFEQEMNQKLKKVGHILKENGNYVFMLYSYLQKQFVSIFFKK